MKTMASRGDFQNGDSVFPSSISHVSLWIMRIVTPGFPSFDISKKETALGQSSAYNQSIYVATVRLIIGLWVVLGIPFCIWDDYFGNDPYAILRRIDLVWSSLLHVSMWLIVAVVLVAAELCPQGAAVLPSWVKKSCLKQSRITHLNIPIVVTVACFAVVMTGVWLQMIAPSRLWNPFLLGWYRVYYPENINAALHGSCFSNEGSDPAFCLEEWQWNELSSGHLSSYNPDDIANVKRGLDYLKHESGGLVINALARDIAENVPALRDNVEGLLPFYGDDSREKLSIVIFENDSIDGTRDEIKKWAREEKEGKDRYTVDLISCGDNDPDCRMGVVERYDNMHLYSNQNDSSVGKLGEFRQIVLDHIMESDKYKDFSHMIILDADLGVSLSPLGLLHTLGLENQISQTHVIASSSTEIWAGSMGTINPPYDFSAFRPKETTSNAKVRQLHKKFCELEPPGDPWRNMCHAASSMQLFMIQSPEDGTHRPYQVKSAFNGITLYPLDLIKSKNASYHTDEIQECEHVVFHLSIQNLMYVNPKWKMNLKPSKPGGPGGMRVLKAFACTVLTRPPVFIFMVFGNLLIYFVFVPSVWMIAISFKKLLILGALNRSSRAIRNGKESGSTVYEEVLV